MEICGGIEAKVDPIGRAAVAIAQRRAVVAWVEVDVDQHLAGVGSRELDIDLLPWGGAMEEESCDEPGATPCPDLRLKPAVLERALGREGSRPIWPRSPVGRVNDQLRPVLAMPQILACER